MKHSNECKWITEQVKPNMKIKFTFENHVGAMAFPYTLKNKGTGHDSNEIIYGVTNEQGIALLKFWNNKFHTWHYSPVEEMKDNGSLLDMISSKTGYYKGRS